MPRSKTDSVGTGFWSRAAASVGAGLLGALAVSAALGAEISAFSPQNTVKDVRQVRATFSEPMIAFGDPRGNGDPFDISCAAPGHGRWADPKNWIYDFDHDLPAGVSCLFKAKAGLKTLAGAALTGRVDYAFDTGGPAIKTSEPWEGSQIDEEQIFILHTDAEADPKSVLEHAYFVVTGLADRIPVKVLDEDPRTDKAALGLTSKVRLWAHKFGLPTRQGTHRAGTAATFLQARRRFPPGAQVTLVWGVGVATASGAATKQDQSLPYSVRPEFSAEFNCERENAQSGCLPISRMNLSFNADVLWRDASKIRLKSEKGDEWKPMLPEGRKKPAEDDSVRGVSFAAPFPEKTAFTITLPPGLPDDAGRTLANAARFPLAVATGEYPPLLKFPSDFGLLELKPEAVLPLTVRNVEAELKGTEAQVDGKLARVGAAQFARVVRWLSQVERKSMATAERGEPLLKAEPGLKTEPLSVHKPGGDRAFEVMGLPLKKAGFYLVEFESPRLGAALLGADSSMYVATAALVTNLSVHFKRGRESSLVWVTSLDQGKPVEGAEVSIRDCEGDELAQGKTDGEGIVRFDRELPAPETAKQCREKGNYSAYGGGLFALAEKGDDFSFVHTSWDKGIEAWRFNLPEAYALTPNYATTVFDRTLFRAGETVHMKHFLRRHTMKGVGSPEKDELPAAVQIKHDESEQTYELPLSWHGDAVAESTWSIPKGAKLGTYSVTLLRQATGAESTEAEENHPGAGARAFHYARHKHWRRGGDATESWASGSFRVEEYRVPLMKGQLKPPAGELVRPKEVPVGLSVEYLSGGGAAKLPVEVRYQSSIAMPIEFPLFDGYSFGLGKIHDPNGGEAPLGPGEVEFDLDAPAPTATTGPDNASKARKIALTLDGAGTGHVSVPAPSKRSDRIRNLQIELDYKDPNGETQTVGRSVPIYPSARLVGIRPDSWFASKESLKFQVAVADLHGKPVANAPVTVELIEQATYSHRKRLVGGFYAYENKNELKHHGQACSGKTDEKGLLECQTKPPVSGNLVLEAKTSDEAGREAFTYSSTWVYDTADWWFAQDDSDRIDLLPERKRFEPGEKATFQVRMPFREGTALVSVEREGVLDSFVVPLSGKKPLIEVPIKPEYAPNVYVSALVVRGRVGDVQPTALVDLGKPAYKLGLSELHVGWKPHELIVRVTPAKEVFQVREKSHFKLQVKTADGSPLPKGSELALAAVDEGLLQLKPNESWKLLESMMRRRGYEVQTFTAQTQVIGKRHFGLKAQPSGGDGGKAPSREILDSLLYWNGRIPLDEHGEAEIEFPMNDSVTGFRLAAVAQAGASLFGTGYASIRTTQDLMILSGIPPLAREGDHLDLQLTLRNTTDKPMSVALEGTGAGPTAWTPAPVALAPQEAKAVTWPVDVPVGAMSLRYELSAQDKLGKASDRLKISEKVVPAVPVRIFQANLAQVEGKYTLPVERPKDAIPGQGGVRLILDLTLLTGLDGVREYMSYYPFTCLEQRVSKAIALQDKKLWDAITQDLPSYLDGDGLARYFPAGWLAGSDILTAYVVSIADEAGWEIPAETRQKMLAGLQGFVTGRIVRISDLPTADLTVRKLAALEALSRHAAATWAMTGSLQINPNLWPTSALIDWAELLRRLKDAPEGELKRKEADQILRSRLNFQGTIMTFSTESVDQLWWMMVSTSTNANRFLLHALEEPGWLTTSDDMGRVVRGAIHRQDHGHWDTTTANAWGTLALEKFAHRFEKDAVGGKTEASVTGEKEQTLDWSASPKGLKLDFGWPEGQGTLSVSHSGSGKPWATVQSRAAIPLKESLFTGYKIQKTLTPVERKVPGKWSRGDIYRVKLELEAQSDMTWVVINDPVPAGATILGSGLGNDSSVASGGEKSQGWAMPSFVERAFDGYRGYYGYVPKGKWSTEYTVRLNQAGHMNLPATRVEAMYAPEMFGELPNESFTVQE